MKQLSFLSGAPKPPVVSPVAEAAEPVHTQGPTPEAPAPPKAAQGGARGGGPPSGGRPVPPPSPPGDGDQVSLLKAARQRYLNYAMSVITSRALPDVRDGLKPVQRRILYAMWANLNLRPEGRFRKSAAVVGEVMARFHPHGDQSIYDAMVRLAQPFSLRSPLVEGQGNFGSMDGDPPAAMRYTEAKLRPLAVELLAEIDQDTVPFRPNYDGTTQEPALLPSRFPQLLVNGCSGIAVGMATEVPPHNLREVCLACQALLRDPTLSSDALLTWIEGPDFPGGGEVLTRREDLLEMYRTGRGAVRLRGTWEIERQGRKAFLIVRSIPYGVNKARLVLSIGERIGAGSVPQLLDVRDESAEDVRIVLELRAEEDAQAAMVWLFRHTELERSVPMNLTVLVPDGDGARPERLGLAETLRHFLDFRQLVVRKRLEYDLSRLRARIHVLEGFETVFDVLDEVIQIIRGSEGKADAAKRLTARFGLDDVQCEAILELKLYRLARLEILEIREELASLRKNAERISWTLSRPEAIAEVVKEELAEVARRHGDDRRTKIVAGRAEERFDADAYIVAEETWLFVTKDGWGKRQRSFTDLSAVRTREGDVVRVAARTSTRDTVAFFSDRGRVYTLRVGDLPLTPGHGEPVSKHFKFGDGERIVAVLPLDARHLPQWEPAPEGAGEEDEEDTIREDGGGAAPEGADAQGGARTGDVGAGEHGAAEEPAGVGPVAVVLTRAGRALLAPLRPLFEPSQKAGRKVVGLDAKDDAVVAILLLPGAEHRLCLATAQGRGFACTASTLPVRRGGRGVFAIRLQDKDAVIGAALGEGPKDGLAVETGRGRPVVICEKEVGLAKRGGKGKAILQRGSLTVIDAGPVLYGDKRAGEPDGVEARGD